jgi:hypothetical protein
MSAKKSARSKAAPNRKGTVPAKQKHVVPSREAALVARTGHWTQWIPPSGAALISERLTPCHVVIKNHGAHTVMLVAQHGDLFDLAPGAVRATYASGIIRVENEDKKSGVLIEFDFYPYFGK